MLRVKTLAALLALVVVCSVAAPLAVAQTTEADVFVAQAILDFDEKRYDQAMASLRRALELEPDNVEALYYAGVVLMAQNKPAEAVPFLEQALAKSPTNPAVKFQLGLAYFAQQSYDKAQPLLEDVFKQDPNQDGLGYYVGFMRYRNKEYQGAIRAFRAARTTSPELQQLTRFYTGLALGLTGQSAQAAAEVEQSLRLAPASALTGPAERLRDTLSAAAAKSRQKRFSLDARIGFFYDDNVSVIPDADNSDPLVGILRQQKHESTGELFAIRADYAFYRDDQWEISGGLSFFTTYNNALPDFNVIDFLGSLGVTRTLLIGAMPAQLGFQYAFDYLMLNEEEFVRRHTVSLVGTLVESEMFLTQGFVRFQNKAFNESSVTVIRDDNRDGNNWMIGFLQFVRFEQDKHFIKFGYQFDWEETDGRNFDYRGHRLQAGGQYTLPWYGIRLKYDFDVHFRDYLHKNTVLPSNAPGTRARSDTELTNIVRGELPLPYNFTLAAEYQRSDVHSNLAVFDYTRNVFTILLSWTY
jgi:Flp pilus assembly protein TadD